MRKRYYILIGIGLAITAILFFVLKEKPEEPTPEPPKEEPKEPEKPIEPEEPKPPMQEPPLPEEPFIEEPEPKDRDLDFTARSTIRIDNLEWTIPGDTHSILSELQWNNMVIYELGIEARLQRQLWVSKASLSLGRVIYGEWTDVDYAGEGRTDEFFRNERTVHNGYTFGASVSTGLEIPVNRLTITPSIGYSLQDQLFNGRYHARWRGPFVGIDTALNVSDSLKLSLSGEYHWIKYNGIGDWQGRPDLAHPKSFEHKAHGTGYVISAGLDYKVRNRFSVLTEIGYRNFQTGGGTDRVFWSNGESGKFRFNGATWDSLFISFSARFRF